MEITRSIQMMIVEETSGKEACAEISEICKEWRDFSTRSIEETPDVAKQAMYRRAYSVTAFVRTKTKGSKTTPFIRNYTTAICYGLDLKIRGFAILKLTHLPLKIYKKPQPIPKPDPQRTYIRLCYLSTNPENLYQELGYKGVGTALIQFLFEKCVSESFAGIFVEPVPGAVSFFEQFNFIQAIGTDSKSKNPMIWRPDR